MCFISFDDRHFLHSYNAPFVDKQSMNISDTIVKLLLAASFSLSSLMLAKHGMFKGGG